MAAQDFNVPCPTRPGVTVGEDLADQNMALAANLIRIQYGVEKLARELDELSMKWSVDPARLSSIGDDLRALVKEVR